MSALADPTSERPASAGEPGRAAAPAARDRQELRPGPGAGRRRPRRAGRPGHRAGRRQRRRQVGADQVHRGDPRARQRPDLLGGPPGAHPDASRRGGARDRDRATRTSRSATTSTSCRTCSSAANERAALRSTRRTWRPRRDETLTSLAVTTVRSIRQPVASLSGGQRQSVAIAKAVLWNSKLVIMDEPTAALGVAQTAMVLDLVRRLADRGLAVLLVSHNMNDVFEVADRIAVLHLGRMVAVRPAAELDRQIVVDLMTTGASTRTVESARTADRCPRSTIPPRRPAEAPDELTGAAREPGEPARSPPSWSPTPSASTSARRSPASRPARAACCPVVGGLLLISILFQSLNSHFLDRRATSSTCWSRARCTCCWRWARSSPCSSARSTCRSASSAASAGSSWRSWSSRRSAGRGGRRSSSRSLACAAIGALQGTIITRLGLPSFVVTLAGLLVLAGRDAADAGQRAASIPINNNVINDIASGNLTPAARWIVMLVIVGLFGLRTWRRDARRRAAGLVAPPPSLTWLKIVARPRRGRRARADLQHGSRRAHRDPGRAVGRAARPRGARRVDVPARPHQVRPLRVRDRRERGGGHAGPASTSP